MSSNRIPFFGLIALVMFLSGCDDSSKKQTSAVSEQPYQGQNVKLLVPESLRLQSNWEVLLQEWSSQTGTSVEFAEYLDGVLKPELFAEEVPNGGRINVFPLDRLCDVDQHCSHLVTDVPEELGIRDLYKGLRERVVSRERSVIVIPIAAPVFVCYYRRDLLKSAGLSPPETWEDYQSLVETLSNWAPNLTAVEPLGPDSRATLFFARSLAYVKHPENYSVWFDLESGDSMMQSPGLVEALTIAQSSWKKMPESIYSMSPQDCRKEVIEGRAALAIAFEPTSVDLTQTRLDRPAGMELGICRLPGSRRVYNSTSSRWETIEGNVHAPNLCGMNGLVVGVTMPPGRPQSFAAWNLLATLADTQFESAWMRLPKTPCRESQSASAPTWNETGLNTEESSQNVDAVAQSLRSSQIVLELPFPRSDEFRKVTSDHLGRLKSESIESSAILSAIHADFERIGSEIGKENLKSDYRRGLGLAPPPKLTPAKQ